MGFFDRLLRRRRSSAITPVAERANLERTFFFGGSPLVKVAGTTTHRKNESQAMMRRRGQGSTGFLEADARLLREHVSPLNRDTIAVAVESETIGYLPLAAAEQVLRLGPELEFTVPLQAFSSLQGDELRVEAWVWLGGHEPRWEWSESRRPPMTKNARVEAAHAAHQKVADDSPTAQRGRVRGVHYLELVEPIKEAKRRGELATALNMAEAAIRGAEKDRGGREPAPWYTEQAAIILRKLGRVDDEVRVLKRWLSFVPEESRGSTRLGQRLQRAEALRGKGKS